MKFFIATVSSKLVLFFSFLLFSMFSLAQETKKVDIDISTGKDDNIFMQPWVWVVGGAVFILLLVALLKNNSKK